MTTARLYIFDVDGTLRWTTVPGQKYPLSSEQWRMMPNVAERLSSIPFAANGPWLAVASNQNGVADGLLSEKTARALIKDALVAALGRVPPCTRVVLCTCSERIACACRKPAPGMLLQLLAHYGVAPGEALFVGDLPIDQEAARRANVPFAWAHSFFSWSA